MEELPKKSRGKQKRLPKIVAVEIDEPLPNINLEAQKKLIQKTALRSSKSLRIKTEPKSQPFDLLVQHQTLLLTLQPLF